uniref:THAP-type domain-containing protein n=1 Tax=Oryzias latipes TaxID=8090 RepID=A0A3P9IAX3_ORYLA
MPSRCVAAGCSNTSSESVSVYKFPKQETLLKQWTKQVQRTRANWVPTASSTLCSQHFEADYMGMHVRYKKVLKPNAIPTIFKRSLVGTSETETPSTSTGSSQYKKRKSVTEKLAQKRWECVQIPVGSPVLLYLTLYLVSGSPLLLLLHLAVDPVSGLSPQLRLDEARLLDFKYVVVELDNVVLREFIFLADAHKMEGDGGTKVRMILLENVKSN